MRIGYYPGSFDPMTNGHLDVLVQGLAICDQVVVGVGVSPTKAPFFSFVERERLIKASLAAVLPDRLSDIRVETFSGLAVDAARKAGAASMLRGLRDSTDFNYEMQIAGMNDAMAPEILTVLFPAKTGHRHITATLVRQIATMGGDVSSFVPEAVNKAIKVRKNKG